MNSFVKVWKEDVVIPTYSVGNPDKNPMFFEKRIYQGSSGVVYPFAVIDKISDVKTDVSYKAVFLENEYLKIMLLPQLGGRIQMALDKTNNYHFIYYNRVIKPALVGLTGPWISGGIEFNWPQHHRPGTFEPVSFSITENEDGSKTVWMGEIEKMFGTKGMAGFTLYPGKAYLEITGKLYNRTTLPQSFLWWANPAVSVNENYQSVFPPDVTAVFDHGRRDVSSFPIATGTYYKVDYSKGVDISKYINIPVPTSYMADHSEYDFMGGYDHEKKAGILHVADHHISPGKKQWTWGCGEFSRAWDKNLTDEDGPYIELMTGIYTDNQPDFSWIQPNEYRVFNQYFMPYKMLGLVKNSNKEAAVNLETRGDNKLYLAVYTTSYQKAVSVILKGKTKSYFNTTVDISPEKVFEIVIDTPPAELLSELELCVLAENGCTLITYSSQKNISESKLPSPAPSAKLPAKIETNDELYITGLHIEQYRHATYRPEDYYKEALRRDASDIRCNNAYGLLLLRRGQFRLSIPCFEKAIQRQTQFNPNPYDGEVFYNLGVALRLSGNDNAAFNAFAKAAWNAAWQDTAFLNLSQLSSKKNDYKVALEYIDKSISRNINGLKARHLKVILLRKMNRLEEALKYIADTLVNDPLDTAAICEQYLLAKIADDLHAEISAKRNLLQQWKDAPHTCIIITTDYAEAGFYEEAIQILNLLTDKNNPLVSYYIGYYYLCSGKLTEAIKNYSYAASLPVDYCFPNSLYDIIILQSAIEHISVDAAAHYLLGNLFYDKRQYEYAIDYWEKSIQLKPFFPTSKRNLAIALYNKKNSPDRAVDLLADAFKLDTTDSRILYELDQLYKKIGKSLKERIRILDNYPQLVSERDDLYLERILLHNLSGEYKEAKDKLDVRKFHPWEGGEGKAAAQYVLCHIMLAKKLLDNALYNDALVLLNKAEIYPDNLNEGRLYGNFQNDINFYKGITYEGLNDKANAGFFFNKATLGHSEPAGATFYNDQPPEVLFYQGLSWRKLGDLGRSNESFERLISYGKDHLNDEVKIDYFAVSLPDMIIFDEDLDRLNNIHCKYLIALGKLGLGELESAEKLFTEVINAAPHHQGAIIHRSLKVKAEAVCL